MASLTRAELAHYPGTDPTEQSLAHFSEAMTPVSPSRCTALPRRIDLRPFPGADRLERAKCYLRAHFPRADSWSEESLDALAGELIRTSEIVD